MARKYFPDRNAETKADCSPALRGPSRGDLVTSADQTSVYRLLLVAKQAQAKERAAFAAYQQTLNPSMRIEARIAWKRAERATDEAVTALYEAGGTLEVQP